MKRMFLAVLLSAGTLASLPAADFHITPRVDIMAGIQGAFLTPSIALTWQPGLVGAGAEVKVPIGLSLGDRYVEAMALLKLGWFDLGAGVSAMLVPPTGDTTDLTYPVSPGGLLFAARVGLTAPLLSLGPGKLGLDVSLDAFATETRLTQAPAPSSLGDLIGQIIVYPFVWLFDMALNSVKLSAGVSYTIGL